LEGRTPHPEASSVALTLVADSPPRSTAWSGDFITEYGPPAASPDPSSSDTAEEATCQCYPAIPDETPSPFSISPSPSPSPSPFTLPSQVESGPHLHPSHVPIHVPRPPFYFPEPPFYGSQFSFYNPEPALYAPQPMHPMTLLAQNPPLLLSPIRLQPAPGPSPSPRPDTPFRGQLDFLLELLRDETYFEALKNATRRSPLLVEMLQEVIEDSESPSQERVSPFPFCRICKGIFANALNPGRCGRMLQTSCFSLTTTPGLEPSSYKADATAALTIRPFPPCCNPCAGSPEVVATSF
jgi:hypothetical protein